MKKKLPINKILLATTSGILLGVSMPKIGLWWSAWVALLPLFIALRGVNISDSFKIGIIAGFVNFAVIVNWLIFVLKIYTGIQWWLCFILFFIFSLYLALYLGFFSVIISFFVRKPYEFLIIAPISWVLLEFARGILFTGFPWEFIGYSQFKQLYIIQIADIFGVYGISFLIVIFNAGAYIFILFCLDKNWKGNKVSLRTLFNCFFSIFAIITSVIFYSYWRIYDIEQHLDSANELRIGIVQGNIDQSVKWDPIFQIATTKKYINLSNLLSSENPDLIVWPETATPFHFGSSPELTDFVVESIKNIGSDFIIGSPSIINNLIDDNNDHHYNSAYLINGNNGEIKDRYDKSHLVPFGEYLPVRKFLKFFISSLIQPYDFEPGVPGNVLFLGLEQTCIGLQICYEIIFPHLSRLMTINGAGLLINLTNDAWFGNSSATYQHFSMSIFRSIENRRSLVRAANTGISAFIDPTGKILARTEIFNDSVLLQKIPILHIETIYTRFGDFFILVCLGVIVYIFLRYSILR